MKKDSRKFYTKKFFRPVLTQSDASDASKVAIRTGKPGFGFAYMNRRETLRLIVNLTRLLLANLREKSVE